MSEQEIFVQALRQPVGDERDRYLHQACGTNVVLRQRIEVLLQAHDEASDFLAKPAIDMPSTTTPPIAELPGSMVGPYRLLQRIGEGGFGIVYMAEQMEPVRRKVALKIIKPGMDTKEVIARFESERQALALMDHPNIARVLDAGATGSGRPYFVMELVKGVPITDFCDKNQLSIAERLSLFVPVCLAVQHAHHKGIIHRDLKPSNVMVTLHDGKPVPKVIDFGVAKATSQQLTQRTLFTAYGQMIGTPVYMSPEQAEMSGLDIDTRSDIYSLGVLLYELLTGTTPLELKRLREVGFLEMQRMIRNVDAPKPSTRVSTLDEEASIVSTNRNTDAKRLRDLLRGDVDWIVMKALEKDRQRRYDTPTAFAEDIQRFLVHEAIHARPPSAAYRTRKFIQRNKGLAAGILAVTASLLIAVVVSSGFAMHANAQWKRAFAAETSLTLSLADAQGQRANADEQRKLAERERDRAVHAELAQKEQAELAESRRQEAERLKASEAQERAVAVRQREAALALNAQLAKSNEEQRRAIYASEMNLVRIEAQRGNLRRMRDILLDQLPINGEVDLRGFEWHYWYRYLNQAQVLMKFDEFQYGKPGSALAIIPGGELAAITRNRQTELIDVRSGKTLRALPFSLRILVDRTRFASTGRSVDGPRNSTAAYHPGSNGPTVSPACFVYEPTGEKLTFAYPDASFRHVSFLNISEDGRYLAALGNDVSHEKNHPACRLLVWNLDTKEILVNRVMPRELNRAEFSSDGKRLAAYLCHGTNRMSDEYREVVVVIDTATGAELGVAQHNDEFDSVFWLPGQERLLLCSLGFSGPNRKELLSWKIGDARPTRLSQESMPDYVKGAVSPDGRWLAVTGHTVPHIRLIDTRHGSVVNTLHNEATTIDSLTFSKDGRRLIACSTTGEVLSWDLGQDTDLFALNSKPLAQLAFDGYALSDDQSLLAVALADGTILTRKPTGEETILKAATAKAARGSSRLRFSKDCRYLAHLTTLGEDGKLLMKKDAKDKLVQSGCRLELYDLTTGRLLWKVAHPYALDKRHVRMEFSVDQRQLAILGAFQLVVMDCQTGQARFPLVQSDESAKMVTGLVRNPITGRLLVAGTSVKAPQLSRVKMNDAFVGDALSGELTHHTEFPLPLGGSSTPFAFPGIIESSPDGEHIGLRRLQDSAVDIWSMRDRRRVLEAPGHDIVFSADGLRAAITRSEPFTQAGTSTGLSAISNVSLFDVSSGRPLSTIALEGTQVDEVRFSPGGDRLLTLHGKRALGSGGAVAQARLWDVNSGREILAIPVAEVNHFIWDVAFDSSGHRLTSFLLGKSNGTGGGGITTVYNATPQSDQDDARLIADRLMKSVSTRVVLKSDWLAELDARPGLKPLVRETVLFHANQLKEDPARLSEAIAAVVALPNRPVVEVERAVRWAELLNKLEPGTMRSRALLGAVQYRLGRFRDAVETVTDGAAHSDHQGETTPSTYDFVRQAIEILARTQLGDESQVRDLVLPFYKAVNDASHELTSSVHSSTLLARLVMEAVYSQPSDRVFVFIAGRQHASVTINARDVDNFFKSRDRNADDAIEESEAAPLDWGPLLAYDSDHDDRLSKAECKSYLLDSKRYSSMLEGKGFEGATFSIMRAMLDESVLFAPNYVPCLNARAWLRATCPEIEFRDGRGAVADANRVGELTRWKSPVYFGTLAAAYAEAGNFDEAVRWQSRLMTESGENPQRQEQLALYRQQKPYRQPERKAPFDLRPPAPTQFVRDHSAALFPPEVVNQSRRISGWCSSWSPDGRKLVRNENVRDVGKDADLSVLDLDTGASTVLIRGGVDPAWSPLPDGPIAFARGPEGAVRTVANEDIWLVNPDGSNLRKLTAGGFPSWTRHGRVFSRSPAIDQGYLLIGISPDKPDLPSPSVPLAGAFPAVSRDGTMFVSIVPGELTVYELNTAKTRVVVPLSPEEMGLADFSPDGRYLVYGSWSARFPGLMLIEVATGKSRLLAKLSGTMPRWSPDGRWIAVDQRELNHIVILDVSSLDLRMGLEQATFARSDDAPVSGEPHP